MCPMTVDPTTLRIVHYPHPTLRETAQPVGAVTDEVKAVARRMIELMHVAPGVGLAAPQVGLPWRMFVANATRHPEDDLVFINPVLSDPGRETDPGLLDPVRVPQAAAHEVLGLDVSGHAGHAGDAEADELEHEVPVPLG